MDAPTSDSTGSGAIESPGWIDRAAYPFAHRSIDLRDGRLHYVDEGSGEPVLFVHGTPTWSFEYRHLVRALSPRQRCIAPDLLGFGLSSRPREFAYTPEAHARVLEEFVTRLGLERFALVVHDFGGPIGLPLCFDDQHQVTALAIMNTFFWPLDDDRRIARGARLLQSVVGRMMYRYANASLRLIMPLAYGERSRLTPAIHRHYLMPFERRADRVLVLHALAKSLLGSRQYYQALVQRADRLTGRPATLIWGMRDTAFGGEYLARWERLLPDATVVKLADAGHWPHEEAPQTVIDAVRRLLAGDSVRP